MEPTKLDIRMIKPGLYARETHVEAYVDLSSIPAVAEMQKNGYYIAGVKIA